MKTTIARWLELCSHKVNGALPRFIPESWVCFIIGWAFGNSTWLGLGKRSASIFKDQYRQLLVMRHFSRTDEVEICVLGDRWAISKIHIINGDLPVRRLQVKTVLFTKDWFETVDLYDELPALYYRRSSDFLENSMKLSVKPQRSIWSLVYTPDGRQYAFIDSKDKANLAMHGELLPQPRMYRAVTHRGRYLSAEELRKGRSRESSEAEFPTFRQI